MIPINRSARQFGKLADRNEQAIVYKKDRIFNLYRCTVNDERPRLFNVCILSMCKRIQRKGEQQNQDGYNDPLTTNRMSLL
ncbi:hypothetical protein AB6A23_06320 [Paenibacillus tarimensis]